MIQGYISFRKCNLVNLNTAKGNRMSTPTEAELGCFNPQQWYPRILEALREDLSISETGEGPNVLYVQKDGGEFITIAAAIAHITDSSSARRYVIRISPGTYTEPELVLPPFVYLKGTHIDAVIIEPDDVNHHIVKLSNRAGMVDLTLQGAGSGYAAIYSHDCGYFTVMHKVTIQDCYIGVLHETQSFTSSMYLEYVDFSNCTQHAIKCTNLGLDECFFNAENVYVDYTDGDPPVDVILISGNKTEANFQGLGLYGSEDMVGNAIRVTNGGYINVSSARIEDWAIGAYVDNVGTTPYLKLQSVDFDDNTMDFLVDNLTATGQFVGSADRLKYSVCKPCDFFVANRDTNIVVVAKKGGDFKTLADAIAYIVTLGDAAEDNKYLINVGPGTFVEPLLQVPSFVYIVGWQQDMTVIQPDADTHHVFQLSNRSGLMFITIANAGANQSGVYLEDIGDWITIHKCSFDTCAIGIEMNSPSVDSYLYLEYVDFVDCEEHAIRVEGVDYESVIDAENTFIQYQSVVPESGLVVDGPKAVLTMQGATISGNSSGAPQSYGVWVREGGYFAGSSMKINNWSKGVYVDTTGVSPYARMEAVDFDDNTMDFHIENSTAVGTFTGYSEAGKHLVESDYFIITGKDDHIITVAKVGGDYSSVKSALDSINDAGPTHRYTISIGPGVFVEDSMILKDYVYIVGVSYKTSVRIQLNTSNVLNEYLFTTSAITAIQNCALIGASILGAAKGLVRYTGGLLRLIGIDWGSCVGGVAIDAYDVSGASNTLTVNDASCDVTANIPLFLNLSTDGIHFVTTTVNNAKLMSVSLGGFSILSGNGVVGIFTNNVLARMGAPSQTCWQLNGSPTVFFMGNMVTTYEFGIQTDASPLSTPMINATATMLRCGNKDVNILTAGAVGSMSLTSDLSKIYIDPASTLQIMSQDYNTGKLLVSGDMKINNLLTIGSYSGDPSGVAGDLYFNTGDKHFYGYNGTAWKQLDN